MSLGFALSARSASSPPPEQRLKYERSRTITYAQSLHQLRAYALTAISHQLIDRLSAHEITNSRAFSTAVQDSKRPIPESTTTGTAVRHFNTSRSLKAVGDSSTIDFAYLPDFDPDTAQSPIIRVPILPQTRPSEANKAYTAVEEEEAVSTNYYIRCKCKNVQY